MKNQLANAPPGVSQSEILASPIVVKQDPIIEIKEVIKEVVKYVDNPNCISREEHKAELKTINASVSALEAEKAQAQEDF